MASRRRRGRKRDLEAELLIPGTSTPDELPDHFACRAYCTCGNPRTDELPVQGKVFWCEVDVAGQRYQVWVDRDYDPRKNEGLCTWSSNRIDILEQALDRMHDALIHEICHAWMDASGMKWVVSEMFPQLPTKERRRLDELFARFEAPAVLSIFRRLGWLHLPTWPPPPKRKGARLRGNRRHPRPH